MPPTPTKGHRVGLSKDHLATAPADTDAVQLFPTIGADDAALEAEGMRRRVVLGPVNRAQERIGLWDRLLKLLRLATRWKERIVGYWAYRRC